MSLGWEISTVLSIKFNRSKGLKVRSKVGTEAGFVCDAVILIINVYI